MNISDKQKKTFLSIRTHMHTWHDLILLMKLWEKKLQIITFDAALFVWLISIHFNYVFAAAFWHLNFANCINLQKNCSKLFEFVDWSISAPAELFPKSIKIFNANAREKLPKLIYEWERKRNPSASTGQSGENHFIITNHWKSKSPNFGIVCYFLCEASLTAASLESNGNFWLSLLL